ncbi:WDFY3 [Cordylochernes scorpioides]|uniref:WDFY3 n=1 Tax=Cordylochernes scorpioides TaxID=51811 RepID=A0ABY6K016_9ARAC|nr:WDFY3 [Cordylochernes scorpioides]
MNIMRRLLVGHSRGAAGEAASADQGTQHTALGLMHLHKVFSELAYPTHPLTQQEQERRLYNMLPLFCKVFGQSPARDMSDKFSDILTFSQLVSRLMVSEIRRRASNQSTEAASCAIAKFLEIEGTEEQSDGWMLLTTVNLLAAGEASIIEVMTASSLPSTLVKCLYLFFDLPELEDSDSLHEGCEFTPRERRILLQKIFVQVLVRLCGHAPPAEELARKDDLTLLFSAITSWCPTHNTVWRKSAAEVLMTLSRHGLTSNVVSYIHNKSCMALCVENMQRIQELSPLEIVEMFVTVFCFLKDSSEVSQVLLDDFRTCQGYIFLSEFLLRMEQDESQDACQALRNLVLLIASLATCGHLELKPSQASSLFQIPSFQLPQPSGQGVSVRNIQAFQVIQSVFLKAQTEYLGGLVLDGISSIYHSDKANYFILEPQHTLSQFAEKIHQKSPVNQEKFFKLLEYVIFELNFVPCKELISLSILLKAQNSNVTCSIACIRSLLNILHFNSIFKEVFREVGLLEVLVTCLHRYAALLKETFPDSAEAKSLKIPDDQQTLGLLVMEALTILLSGNASNAAVFRESGGARCAHNLVPYPICRQPALGIVQQLILSNGGDDDMGTLLGLMHTAPALALDLKLHILKSLLFVLKESHRTRTVFRKVGGFVYIMSVLVAMEGCLADVPKPPWHAVEKKQILSILKTVFTTLTMAMRYEPANARFFASEICHTSLTDTIRLLGCFSSRTELSTVDADFIPAEELTFHSTFTSSKDPRPVGGKNLPSALISTCLVLRLMYDMALDAFDKPAYNNVSTQPLVLRRVCSDPGTHPENAPPNTTYSPSKKPGVAFLSFAPPSPDPLIVHPGVVISMFHLLPSIGWGDSQQVETTLQIYLAEVLRSLVRSERNQQVMCDAGLPGELLHYCRISLEDEKHPLHPSLQYILERLSAQSLEAKDLRAFLRLGSPLCCVAFDEMGPETKPANQRDGGPVPLTRIKTLVSMTTPRDCRLHGTPLMPPFVEFDMTAEGFSCLYLPSIAPQSISAPALVGVGMAALTSDSSVVGGVGTGDRVFPPQTGLTFSTWICVEKFSDPHTDPHPPRLLTLVRNILGRDDNLLCFNLQLSARDRALLVSTHEAPLTQVIGLEPETDNSSVRVWCPELLQEGQWHHLVVVLNRAVLKNSSVSIYVDGQFASTHKLHYISQNPGGGAANLTVASSVYGFIGTPPLSRHVSRLIWKQGPCYLLEDVLSSQAISLLFQLGPCYTGSLQAPIIQGTVPQPPLTQEEKVIFGMNAAAVSIMTLAKIRKVYSKADCKSIAKILGMSSHENATPIRILHNSAGHLAGPARSLGGVLVGYLGARTFVPHPVAMTIENVGGTAPLLGMVAMAKDVEGLYAAVKALVCVVKSNRAAQNEMDRLKHYQTLAMLLKKKQKLLNSHILHLAFSLVGTIDSGRESNIIPNPSAYEDLLCNLEVWHDAPNDLKRSLYEHFYDLVAESSEHKTNIKIVRELEMVSRLLHVLRNQCLNHNTVTSILSLLAVLLKNTPKSSDILSLGQFIASTIPTNGTSEANVDISLSNPAGNANNQNLTSIHMITLRNKLLNLFYCLLFSNPKVVNYGFCEELARVLGFDWILLFMQPTIHSSSMIWGLKILNVFLSHNGLLQKFREAANNGGWLTETEAILQNRMGVLLGFNMGTTATSKGSWSNREIRTEAFQLPGFQHLQWLMKHHIHIPESYYLMLAVLLGYPMPMVPSTPQINMDSLWSCLFGIPAGNSVSRGEVCSEALNVLFNMVHAIFIQATDDATISDYATTLLQFLMYIYHNRPEFMNICMNADVITAMAACLFPPPSSGHTSEVASPVEEFNPDETFISYQDVRANERGSNLITHSSRKFILDFIRSIFVDSLSLQSPSRQQQPLVIDILLDATPSAASHAQIAEYQTEILSTMMEHLLTADVLMGEETGLPIVSGGSAANVGPNISYFTSCMVDKLWQGTFKKDPQTILDFVLKLVTQVRRKGQQTFPLDLLYHSLNRTILYLLSRPLTPSSQDAVVDCLRKVITHRNLILVQPSGEAEFCACLVYCLLHILGAPNQDKKANSTWHVPRTTPTTTPNMDGFNMVTDIASKVWNELYQAKRQVLEESFRVSLGSPPPPSLNSIHHLLMEPAHRAWGTFLEAEKKSTFSTRDLWQSHQSHFQSKIQKVTGGLSRLASRKIKKEQSAKIPYANVAMNDVEAWTLTHISLVQDLSEFHFKQFQQNQQYLEKYVFDKWLQTESELTRERALWGPNIGSRLDKWMLDMTEGPGRMRKKMIKNELFYIHYPYRLDIESGDNKALKYKVATCFDSKEYYKRWRPENMVEQDIISPEALITEEIHQDLEMGNEEREIGFQGLRTASLLPRSPMNRSSSDWDEEPESMDTTTDGANEQEDSPDSQSVLRLLEEGEKISHMFRCARIQGLDTCEGLLLFGKEHFYVVDGFTLLKTREIRDIDSLPANMHDPIIPNSSSPRNKHQKRMCSKFAYEDVRDVHKRRYLLQPIALEVFSADGRNYLLVFPRKLRNKVYQRFMTVATAITDSAQDSLAGQKRGANVESSTNLITNLIGETSVTQRWVRGDVNNFQYLMHLNTLAGRSYNDLMQYPVFPWVLADYDSEELDLNNPATFRDFSTPMGSQTPDRLEQFKKRFKEWDDPHGETPPYHYGTFYSSAMIVASYLVRMEPFTQHFLRLQGGHFDLADRMFHSVKDAWLSAAKHNMADIKELIPEFFYLPEFLLNSNHFDLGCKQNGIQLDHVLLPPWAKNDPREFIRVHRQALECDYVSAHLHEWIDLIFGYKQQGQPAVEAVNVFHHLFYEGNVDIYNIDDPLKKNATIGFINNFGQIPKQLFKKPHPSKKLNNRTSVIDPGPIIPGLSCSSDKLFFHNLDNLKPALTPLKELKGPVGQIIQHEKSLLAVEQNKVLIPPNWSRYIAWGFADHSLRIGNYESDKANFVWEDTPKGEILCCSCVSDKIFITAGTNSMVTVWHYDKKKFSIRQNLHGHTEPVTCLATSRNYNLIVSGSRDHSCIIWDLNCLTLVRQLRGHPAPVAAVSINDVTGDIATCAGTFLYLWTINGDEIAYTNTATGRSDRNQQILCVAFSYLNEWDNQNVIMTGSTDGIVRMWSTDYVQVPESAGPNSDPFSLHASSSEKSLDKHEESKAEQIVRRMSLAGTEDAFNSASSTLRSSRLSPVLTILSKSPSGSSLSEEEEDKSQLQHSKTTIQLAPDTSGNTLTEPEKPPLRSSKSDTSLLDSYVVIDQQPRRILKDGFKWQCQLVFRSKLTMHTAFERKDNPEPAAVTALAVSKHHKSVYVGDVRGRVFSWSVTDQPGRADHWVRDEGSDACQACSVRFSFAERRHHCRNCGQLFCSRCSRFESEIVRLRILKPVRICQTCYNTLKASPVPPSTPL